MNVKLQRTNSDILRIVSVALRDMDNLALRSVSVLSVETAADFATAKVFVEISGDEEYKKSTMAELERASGFLRNEIAQRVNLRQTPQLRFVLDRGRENANRVEELLQQIKNEAK